MVIKGWDAFGNIIELQYSHMASIDDYIKEGVQVEIGDIIGVMGDTGGDYDVHLHLELRINGVTQNPMEYMQP